MVKEPLRVVVTGAAGQIGYFITYMIARGEVFGPQQPVCLILMDLPEWMHSLDGLCMELTDCALPLLRATVPTSELVTAFKGVDAAFLVGAVRGKRGMERKDLMVANVKIFKEHGKALNRFAKKTVKVLVVSNPCNTNAYICSKFAPTIPPENFSALSRLDENRATAQIAEKLDVPVNSIKNMVIWGNNSVTQVPDVSHAIFTTNGTTKSVADTINDPKFLQTTLMKTVAQRDADVIAARKLSPAMSVAKAACDQMHDWFCGTSKDQFVSMSVISDESYGAPRDVMFSFPVEIKRGKWSIVQGLNLSEFVEKKIEITGNELIDERNEALAIVRS